jgi:MFS family permease
MAFLEWAIHETSLFSLFNHGNRDVYIILLCRYLRMIAYGGAALVLGVFLWVAGNKGTQIGTFMSLTLLGDAAISYVLTVMADKIGRRKVLLIGSLLMTLAGTVFTFTKNYYVLLFAAIVGVISPGAHEVGPFRAVEVCRGLIRPSTALAVLTCSRNLRSPNLLPSKHEPMSTHGLQSHRPWAWLAVFVSADR